MIMETMMMKRKLLLSGGALFAVLCCIAAEPADVFRKGTKELMPAAAKFREAAPLSWEILDRSGAKLGTLHQERIGDSERQQGFGGPVEIAIVAGRDGKVAGVLVGKNQETPGFLNRVVSAGFLEKWNGMTMQEAAEAVVDTVTSATYSSGAIAHGVKTLAAELADDKPAAGKSNGKSAPAPADKALEAEAARLARSIAASTRLLCRGTLLFDQWRNRRAEELELREILLLKGRDAGRKFAAEHKLAAAGRAAAPPAKGTPLAAALAAYRASGKEADLQKLRAEIARELDFRTAALLRQNAEHAEIILVARKQLIEIAGKLGRKTPWSQGDSLPDGKKKK